MKFTYKDNKKNGEVVFECYADSISEADLMYKEAIGQIVMKQPYIGCIVEKEKTNE